MISFLKHGLSMVIANSRLILSGELIITDQHMNPLDAQDITALGIDETISKIQKHCRGLQVRQVNGLCDFSIRLFAKDCPVEAAGFYDWLQAALTDCARRIYAKDGLSLRLNVIGKLKSLGKIEEFRFLNKEDLVSYKVTGHSKEFSPCTGLRKKAIHKLSKKPAEPTEEEE